MSAVRPRTRAAGYWTAFAIVVAVLLLAPLVLPPFWQRFVTEILIWGLLAMSSDILIGYTGMVSFGHSAFFGLGMYGAAAALLTMRPPSLWLALVYGLVAAGAVAVAWLAWILDTPPADGSEWGARVVILVALLAPPVVLLLFVAGLRDLRYLPDRTRALPADVSARARHLRDRGRGAAQATGIMGAIVALFRLGREVLASRDALSPFGAIAIVLRPAILLAAVFAMLAAVLEVPAALVSLLILAVT